MNQNRNPKINSEEILTEEEILNIANADSGIDMDGDIITIDGVNYYVNVFNKLVRRV